MADKFDQWGIVEIMGHDRIAGRITEESIGGSAFVRVDVPDPDNCEAPAYTKLLGQHAIFSISLTTEETARAAARHFRPAPMAAFDARRLLEAPRDDDFNQDVPY